MEANSQYSVLAPLKSLTFWRYTNQIIIIIIILYGESLCLVMPASSVDRRAGVGEFGEKNTVVDVGLLRLVEQGSSPREAVLLVVDRELVLDKPGDAGCTTCLPVISGPYECVTQIHVVRAVGLQRSDADAEKGRQPHSGSKFHPWHTTPLLLVYGLHV